MNHQNQQSQPFIIEELLDELYAFVKDELYHRGKAHVDVNVYRNSENQKCRIQADRELLREAFDYLLCNACAFTDKGFICFGYHVLKPDLVDFFVNDTRSGKYHADCVDMPNLRDLLQKMGSQLKVKYSKGTAGASCSFSIESEQVELTKIA